MSRLEAFRELRGHPWLGRGFAKLTKAELALAERFLQENEALDRGAFDAAVQRMFLDKPEKPRNHLHIMELLTNANSSFKEPQGHWSDRCDGECEQACPQCRKPRCSHGCAWCEVESAAKEER